MVQIRKAAENFSSQFILNNNCEKSVSLYNGNFLVIFMAVLYIKNTTEFTDKREKGVRAEELHFLELLMRFFFTE